MADGKIKVLIGAGGTGGHLIPAQKLAKVLKEKGCTLFFVGKGLKENSFFEKEFLFEDVVSAPFKKGFFNIFKMAFLLLKGTYQSLKIIKRFKPDIVVGFGSYHSFPVILSSYLKKKPIILFEANCQIGKVNRFFAKRVKALAVQFPLFFDEQEVIVKRFPWNLEEEKNSTRRLFQGPFTILILGGSQGARFINNLFYEAVPLLQKEGIQFQVIHLIGLFEDEEKVKDFYEEQKVDAFVKRFSKDMQTLIHSSDLAIARAGAATISEFIHFELPSILIPFPEASENHQDKNADFLEKVIEGAIKLDEKKLTPNMLFQTIRKINLSQMKKNIQDFKRKEKIRETHWDLVIKIGGENGR